jgi:hypothetical protein
MLAGLEPVAQEALGNWLQNACLKYQTTDLGRGMAEDVGDVGHVRFLWSSYGERRWPCANLATLSRIRGQRGAQCIGLGAAEGRRVLRRCCRCFVQHSARLQLIS